MGDFDVFGNVILLTPPAHADRDPRRRCRRRSSPDAGWAAGASRLPNDAGLVYQVVGTESRVVRAKVHEFWGVVRRRVRGADLPRDFWWR